ncbi:MAG: hypothetical protein O9346_01750 [Leptospiraceae bacterium]|jgi:hypothetical protein|nr:hypothetical protein [Leptospiraceae bacterium]
MKLNFENLKNGIVAFFTTNTRSRIGTILYVTIAIIVLFLLKPYVSIKPEQDKIVSNFQKADYSSDKNWLGCRQHQHDCIYTRLWNNKDSKSILQECGNEDICDDLYGDK